MFSLRSLLLATAVAAVFVAAFLNASPMWAGIIVTLMVLLIIAALVSIYLFADNRPFFVCALIGGMTYGSMAIIRPLGISENVITSRILFHWWLAKGGDEIETALGDSGIMEDHEVFYWLFTTELPRIEYSSLEMARVLISYRSFQLIGHCAIALILAVIAGLIGSCIARRRDVNVRANDVQS